jgi:prepilin-type N-terminal cleavage/methylation domain-containing protein
MRPLRRGFTLIEMLVVVTVMGLMMAIIIPRMRTSPGQYVSIAARQVVRDLESTRARALTARRATRVCFNPSVTGDYAGFLDDDNNGTIAETAAEVTALESFPARTLGDGVIFGKGNATGIPGDTLSLAVTLSDDDVDFDSRGIPAPFGAGGVVYLTHPDDPNFVAAIQIQAAGSFRLWYWRGGGWQ